MEGEKFETGLNWDETQILQKLIHQRNEIDQTIKMFEELIERRGGKKHNNINYTEKAILSTLEKIAKAYGERSEYYVYDISGNDVFTIKELSAFLERKPLIKDRLYNLIKGRAREMYSKNITYDDIDAILKKIVGYECSA